MKDAIIVLGGGINPDSSLPPLPKLRVEKGVKLYKKGIARYMIVTGKLGYSVKYTPRKTEARVMKDYAVSLGIPKNKIFTENKSRSTIENARFTKEKLLEPKRFKDLVIVTSEFHIKRSKYIFNKILGKSYNLKFLRSNGRLSKSRLKNMLKEENSLLKLAKQTI